MPDVYLDNAATTPVAPEVLEAMLPWLREGGHGNPSCQHRVGQAAKKALDGVRRQFVATFGCGSDEVVFTSGGTESNNLAIKGAALAHMDRGKHIVVGAAEHGSVLYAARWLTRFGFEVTEVPVDDGGQVTPKALEAALRKDTILVSVMHAQNVVGTINRVDELAEVLAGRRIIFHTDAIQSAGKIPSAFPFLGADLMSIAGHKMYGPKGVGALIVRRGLNLEPLLHGVGQERGRRSGTEDVAGIVGLGAAIKLAHATMAEAGERMVALRDAFHLRLADALTGVKQNGDALDRLPNLLHVSFLGVTGAAIAERCPDLILATGPACHDRSAKLPPALAAMRMDPARAAGALRLSLGRHTTLDEVELASEQIVAAVTALRAEAGSSLPASASAPSDLPRCPRCETRTLRLELTGMVPAVVCADHPRCRYEAPLATPVHAA
jgi:cysteine desulfurase